jgi:hypothetical protein
MLTEESNLRENSCSENPHNILRKIHNLEKFTRRHLCVAAKGQCYGKTLQCARKSRKKVIYFACLFCMSSLHVHSFTVQEKHLDCHYKTVLTVTVVKKRALVTKTTCLIITISKLLSPCHKGMGDRGTTPAILNFGTRWRGFSDQTPQTTKTLSHNPLHCFLYWHISTNLKLTFRLQYYTVLSHFCPHFRRVRKIAKIHY